MARRGAGVAVARLAKLERFEGRAAFNSWLYRVATNVCLTMLDSRTRLSCERYRR